MEALQQVRGMLSSGDLSGSDVQDCVSLSLSTITKCSSDSLSVLLHFTHISYFVSGCLIEGGKRE